MIIYRITGCVLAYPDDKPRKIQPTTYSTLTTGRIRLYSMAKAWNTSKWVKMFDISLEKLLVPSRLSKSQILELAAHTISLDDLIQKKEIIMTFSKKNEQPEVDNGTK